MKKEYILECPFCGMKHSIEKNGESLLSDPHKVFSLQCASSFTDDGCKETIIIMSQKSLDFFTKR